MTGRLSATIRHDLTLRITTMWMSSAKISALVVLVLVLFLIVAEFGPAALVGR
jgi:hypothetical protein